MCTRPVVRSKHGMLCARFPYCVQQLTKITFALIPQLTLSLVVRAPAANARSWWPRQIPKIGICDVSMSERTSTYQQRIMRTSRKRLFTGHDRFCAIRGVPRAVADEDAVEMVCYIASMKSALFPDQLWYWRGVRRFMKSSHIHAA